MSKRWDLDVEDVSAAEVKERGAELGIDLVGIADAAVIEEHPPPGDNDTTPDDIVTGAASVIAIADRTTHGASSIRDAAQTPGRRTADFANELAIEDLEDKALELVYYLEDHGHPSLMVSPELSRTRQHDQLDEGPLSLPHVAVEAGLGTLGLNLQLLTPEYGPRVVLGAVVTTADLEPDERLEEALCAGAECGRCLLASPGDAVGYFELDAEAERPYTEPWGYDKLLDRAGRALEADSPEEMEEVIMDRDTMMVWQSMLRGVGIYTGSTRTADVCPVGDDYGRIAEVQRDIPEATEAKRERLRAYRNRERDGELPAAAETYRRHRRWIGALKPSYDERDGLDFDYLD